MTVKIRSYSTIHRFCHFILTRLPYLKGIRLGSVRSSHLPFKMHQVGYVRPSLPPYINAFRINRDTHRFLYLDLEE